MYAFTEHKDIHENGQGRVPNIRHLQEEKEQQCQKKDCTYLRLTCICKDVF